MRAVDIKNGTGPAESLFINENVDTPTLKSGDVLVRVKVSFRVKQNGLDEIKPPVVKRCIREKYASLLPRTQAAANQALNCAQWIYHRCVPKTEYVLVPSGLVLEFITGCGWVVTHLLFHTHIKHIYITDLLQREGKYPVPPQAPKTLGVEFSGTVERLGEGATGFKEGDKVFGLAYGGAYAEFIAVSEKMCIHKPDELSYEQAACIPETWMTATQVLWVIGSFEQGQKVLIHAGASSVGISAIQLAISHGASAVFITAGSDEKIAFCINNLGATAGFNYKTQDFAAEILKATDYEGVDMVIDFVGQSHFQKNIEVAAKDGRIVMLALLSGNVVREVDLGPVLYKRLRIEGTTLRSRSLEYQEALRKKFQAEALPGLKCGKYKIYIERTFSWKDIVEAHKLMETSKTKGKIICLVD